MKSCRRARLPRWTDRPESDRQQVSRGLPRYPRVGTGLGPTHDVTNQESRARDEARPTVVGGAYLGLVGLVLLAGCGQAHPARDGGPGARDAGRPDAGRPDAGPPDAGPRDAGPRDAGPPDAGPPDAGPPDAGAFDAGPPDAGDLVDAGGGGVVRGTVRYEDRPYDTGGFTGRIELRSARAIAVSLLDGAGALVAETRTDDDGRFELPHGLPVGTRVTVQARAEVVLSGHSGRVIDRRRGGGRVYALESPSFDVAAAGDVAMLAQVSTGLGGAFNIVDVLYSAFVVYAPHVGAAAPRLTVQWQAGLPWPCSSCYGGDVISLGGQVEDTDEYDDGIILHEVGHYFVDHYSRDTSPGGSHRDRLVTPEHAYGEGLAYFFASMVLGDPLVVDTYIASNRIMEFEAVTLDGISRTDFFGTSNGRLDGQLREEIVAGILWDAFDGPTAAEPFDRVALGAAGVVRILVDYFGTWPHPDQGASGIDIADFLYALVCVAGVPAADAEALAADRAFPWTASPCVP